jgi:hypothetical protein
MLSLLRVVATRFDPGATPVKGLRDVLPKA